MAGRDAESAWVDRDPARCARRRNDEWSECADTDCRGRSVLQACWWFAGDRSRDRLWRAQRERMDARTPRRCDNHHQGKSAAGREGIDRAVPENVDDRTGHDAGTVDRARSHDRAIWRARHAAEGHSTVITAPPKRGAYWEVGMRRL